VVQISLDEASYDVAEGDGFISGCMVLEGLIERNVTINLFTEDDTATGIYRVLTIPNVLKSKPVSPFRTRRLLSCQYACDFHS